MAGGMDLGAEIVGLREFRTRLKDADPQLRKGMQRVNKDFATEVAVDARSEYASIYQTHTHKHQDAIRAVATQTSAGIRLDGSRDGAGGLLGHEFGSYGGPNRQQFKAYVPADSGRGGAGFFLYPTIRKAVPHIMEAYGDVLGATLHEIAAGF